MTAFEEVVRRRFEYPEQYLKARSVIRFRAWLVKEILQRLRGCSLLDVGCGDGSITQPFLDDNWVTFLDISHPMLEKAARSLPAVGKDRARFVQASLFEPPFAKPFDIVICLGVMAHLGDHSAAIQRLAGLVRTGGLCLLQFTDGGTLMAKMIGWYVRLRKLFLERSAYPLIWPRGQELLEAARKAGLKPIRIWRHACPLPGSRILGQVLEEKYLRWSCCSVFARWGCECVVLFVKSGVANDSIR
jgi:SAM-dependent methyltransferase